MTAEFIEPVTKETSNLRALVEESPRPTLKTLVGEYVANTEVAFEGFVPIGEVQSPFEHIRACLQERIIGQSAAIDTIISSLEASKARMKGDDTPEACLAFLGPTGVGKSQIAKELSAALDPTGDGNLIVVNGGSYSNGYEVSNLTGSAKGYIGSDTEPLITNERLSKPGTVVLFDEVEKAHPKLHRLLLEIMGSGKLQIDNKTDEKDENGKRIKKGNADGSGEIIDFRNVIIIMTSNLGSKEIAETVSDRRIGFGGKRVSEDKVDELATKAFNKFFDPEFIGRLSAEVVFEPLSKDQLYQVLDLKLTQANEGFIDEHGVRISLSDSTRDYLIDMAAQHSELGARPIEHALKREVLSSIGRYIGGGHLPEGTHVRAFHKDEISEEDRTSETTLQFMSKPDETIVPVSPMSKALVRFEGSTVTMRDGSTYIGDPSMLQMLSAFYREREGTNSKKDGFTHNYVPGT